jgi:hypothetical protein
MSEHLRNQILDALRTHAREGSPTVKGDTELANSLSQPIGEVQRQLDILEHEGHVKLTKAMGPSYGAWITPVGLLHLERSEARAPVAAPPSGGRQLPDSVIAEVAAALSEHYTHSRLDNLFRRHGAPGEAPPGNKLDKVTEWLARVDADPSIDSLKFLGQILQAFMEVEPREPAESMARWQVANERVRHALAQQGFAYQTGGFVVGALATPAQSLEEIIRNRDLPTLHIEFRRALANVETDPPAAITAACAILESLCKVYIGTEGLPMPSDQSLKPVWRVVQEHLKLDPARASDADMKRILGGMASVVDGVGAFRTHVGSAHGQGLSAPNVQARHARLAVHAAETLVAFVLETWAK